MRCEVPQLSSRLMKEIESSDEHDLPPSCHQDREKGVYGAAKFSQVGIQAAGAILRSLFQDANVSHSKGAIIVDLWPRVGDFAEAGYNTFLRIVCE